MALACVLSNSIVVEDLTPQPQDQCRQGNYLIPPESESPENDFILSPQLVQWSEDTGTRMCWHMLLDSHRAPTERDQLKIG